ncbi:MAG: transcription antitermination factor NusB [Bacillota bacterium]
MIRRRARELALQVLYQIDLVGTDLEEAWRDALEREQPEPAAREYAETLVRGVQACREELDREIARRSRDWPLERMAVVDRNILRIGLYELFHIPSVPPPVVANEAVELAKAYSTADSGRFVNGILGSVIKELAAQAASSPPAPGAGG